MTAPAIILSHTQMGENVGAAARAMKNFGLSELRLIAPKMEWPNDRAQILASGAGEGHPATVFIRARRVAHEQDASCAQPVGKHRLRARAAQLAGRAACHGGAQVF